MKRESVEKIVVELLNAEDKNRFDELIDKLVNVMGYGEFEVDVNGEKYVVRIQKAEHRLIGMALARMALGLYQEVRMGNRNSIAIAPLLRERGKLLYVLHALS